MRFLFQVTILTRGRNDIFIGVRPSFKAVIAAPMHRGTRDPVEVAAVEVSEQITITK